MRVGTVAALRRSADFFRVKRLDHIVERVKAFVVQRMWVCVVRQRPWLSVSMDAQFNAQALSRSRQDSGRLPVHGSSSLDLERCSQIETWSR